MQGLKCIVGMGIVLLFSLVPTEVVLCNANVPLHIEFQEMYRETQNMKNAVAEILFSYQRLPNYISRSDHNNVFVDYNTLEIYVNRVTCSRFLIFLFILLILKSLFESF